MTAPIDIIREPAELTFERKYDSGRSGGFPTLMDNAKASAPHFCAAILANKRRSKLLLEQSEVDLESLRGELQQWFIGLFKPRTETQEVDKYKVRPGRSGFQLPLSFLLPNLGIILRYGREVSARSPQSEQSQMLFIQSLSDELARKQDDAEQRLEYLTSLLLLD